MAISSRAPLEGVQTKTRSRWLDLAEQLMNIFLIIPIKVCVFPLNKKKIRTLGSNSNINLFLEVLESSQLDPNQLTSLLR